MASSKAVEAIKSDEGTKPKAYLDSEDILTVGTGFNLERPDAKEQLILAGVKPADVDSVMKVGGKALTDEQIDALFQTSLQDADRDAKALYPNWDTMPQTVRDTLTNMSFQLGGEGLRKFTDMNEAVVDSDWKTMEAEMNDSLWAKQTPNRAKRLTSEVAKVKTPPKPKPVVAKAMTQKQEYQVNLRRDRAQQMAAVMSRQAMVQQLAKAMKKTQEQEQEQEMPVETVADTSPKPKLNKLEKGLFEDEKGTKFFVDGNSKMFELGEDNQPKSVIDPSTFDLSQFEGEAD